MGVPKAFHVRIDRLMWGFSGRGVASALVAGPRNWMGGRKDRVSGGCILVALTGKSRAGWRGMVWCVASAIMALFSGSLSRHFDVMVLYRDSASQSANIRTDRCSTVKWYMRSAARHRCSTCVAACSLSGSSSKKPFKPWESAIHVNSAPRKC